MFGTEIVSRFITTELATPKTASGFTGAHHGLPVYPMAVVLPALAFYPEFSEYNGPMQGVEIERLRFVIKAMTKGTSTAGIRPIATAVLNHFNDLRANNYVYDAVPYQITFAANGELLPTTVVEQDGTFYRQLGTVFNVELTRGG